MIAPFIYIMFSRWSVVVTFTVRSDFHHGMISFAARGSGWMSERSKERDSREADLLIVKIRLRWKAIFTRMCAIIRVCYALVGSNPTSAIFLSRRICCSAHCLDEKVTIIMSVNFKYSTIKYVWGLFSLLKNWESWDEIYLFWQPLEKKGYCEILYIIRGHKYI